jgi:hypothetical protein
MIKRTVSIAILALALEAPAAHAAPGNGGREHGQQLKQQIHRFVVRCAHGKADADKCKAAARRIVERLEKLDARLAERIAKIRERCSDPKAPKRCERADHAVERLQAIHQRIVQVEQKLQEWLSGSGSSVGSGSGSGSTGAGDDAGLESLEDLAADLAAAQAAQTP